MPRLSRTFVGRTREIAELLTLLTREDQRLSVSIEGLAGVGKTELASALVRQLGREGAFPGGIYWLAVQGCDLGAAWAALAATLGMRGEADELTAAMLARVCNATGEVLLVLDNVAGWDDGAFPSPIPGSNCRLLLTSRTRNCGGSGFEPYPLDVLGSEDAVALYEKVSGRPATDALELLSYLDGHALAVEIAAALLGNRTRTAPAEYLRQLIEGSPPRSNRVSHNHRGTVESALRLLHAQLGKEDQRAWAVFARFEPTVVTVALMEAAGICEDRETALRRWHLVKAGEAPMPGSDSVQEPGWRMHRLVSHWGKRLGTEAERALASASWASGLLARARKIDLLSGFEVYLADRAHFDVAAEVRPEEMDRRAWSELLDRLGTGARSAGEFARAERWFRRALEVDLRDLGEDHADVATSRSNLAAVLREQGELAEARELLECALASALARHGESHPTVATRRSKLALVLQAQGNLAAARGLLEAALASAVASLGDGHPTVAIRRSRLAGVLRAEGDLVGARELLEAALETDLRNHGEDHPTVNIDRTNLAHVLQASGEVDTARQLLEVALDSALRRHGDSHPSVANRRSQLALVLQLRGELEAAQCLQELALESTIGCHGRDHPAVAIRRSRLAEILRARTQLQVARAEALEALRVARLQAPGAAVRVGVERALAWAAEMADLDSTQVVG